MQMRTHPVRPLSVITTLAVLGMGGLLPGSADAQGGATLLMHSGMDDAQAIHQPDVNQATYATQAEAVVSPGSIDYVSGQFGGATRFSAPGGAWDGKARFRGENFDFDDPAQDGGRLDMWVRFDDDPNSAGNVFLMSEWTGTRNVNIELTGSPSALMLDVYGEVPSNERTNYEKFRINPRDEAAWQDVAAGEWHLYTWLWRNNGDQHKDEIHYYIDGTWVGSDFNGNLPTSVASFPYLGLAPDSGGGIGLTVDEIYSFDGWDVSAHVGHFADLVIPEGVTPTYPMDNRYPVWGSAVPVRNFDLAFYVVIDESPSCQCDVYLDDSLIGSVVTESRAYTEVPTPYSLTDGTHTYQVKCDDDRLVSDVVQFQVESTDTPVEEGSVGGLKRRYRQRR